MLNSKNKLILGTAQFDNQYGLSKNKYKFNRSNIKKILNYLQKVGLKTLDTSTEYKNVDKKINLRRKKNFKVISKIKFNNKEINKIQKKELENKILNRIKKSKKNLGLKKFEALLIHNFEILNLNNQKKIFEVLLDIKKKGIFNKIGFSIYDFQKLLKTLKNFTPEIVQCPYNIFDRRLNNKRLIELLKRKKISIHARSIFLKGLLLTKPNKLPKKVKRFFKPINNWHTWTLKNKIDKISALLSFAFLNKNIDKIVIGIQDFNQLKEILRSKIEKRIILKNFENKNFEIISPNKW